MRLVVVRSRPFVPPCRVPALLAWIVLLSPTAVAMTPSPLTSSRPLLLTVINALPFVATPLLLPLKEVAVPAAPSAPAAPAGLPAPPAPPDPPGPNDVAP